MVHYKKENDIDVFCHAADFCEEAQNWSESKLEMTYALVRMQDDNRRKVAG